MFWYVFNSVIEIPVKVVFHFSRTYRSETQRILLCPYRKFCVSAHETMKYATFRYDTVEVENGLIFISISLFCKH